MLMSESLMSATPQTRARAAPGVSWRRSRGIAVRRAVAPDLDVGIHDRRPRARRRGRAGAQLLLARDHHRRTRLDALRHVHTVDEELAERDLVLHGLAVRVQRVDEMLRALAHDRLLRQHDRS